MSTERLLHADAELTCTARTAAEIAGVTTARIHELSTELGAHWSTGGRGQPIKLFLVSRVRIYAATRRARKQR